jgi:hypothetical protein
LIHLRESVLADPTLAGVRRAGESFRNKTIPDSGLQIADR